MAHKWLQELTTFLRQEPWLDAPPRTSGVAPLAAGLPHECVVARPTTAPVAKTGSISTLPRSLRSWQSNHAMFEAELSAVKLVSPASSQRRLPRRLRRYARAMTSQWYTNVNKVRQCQAPTWRKPFKWTHFTAVWKYEWICMAIVYVQEVIWSRHFQSTKRNITIESGIPLVMWC